jgi:hypothetical protein
VRASAMSPRHDPFDTAMNSTRLLVLIILASLPFGAQAVAQTGEDLLRFGQRDIGFSPRTVGLAGATAGGVADWGATVSNPASLGLVRTPHVTGSFDVTTTLSEAPGADARATRFTAGHGAYVAAMPTVRGSFVTGVGYHHVNSLYRRLFFSAPVAGGTETGELYESGWLSELSGVAAFEAAPRFYVGASLNAVFGDYAFTEFAFPPTAPASSIGLDSQMRGVNFRVGLVAETVPGLRLGLSAESPTWLHAEETFSGPDGRELFSYSMQMPWRVVAGGAFEFEGLLVTADIEFADWASARLRPTSRFVDENRDIQRLYRETIDARVGIEYDFGLGAVRAGYAIAQDPLRDELPVDRLQQTVGSGFSYYVQRGITLDVAAAFTGFDDVIVRQDGIRIDERVGRLRLLAGLQINL